MIKLSGLSKQVFYHSDLEVKKHTGWQLLEEARLFCDISDKRGILKVLISVILLFICAGPDVIVHFSIRWVLSKIKNSSLSI